MSITFQTFDAAASLQLKTCIHQAHSEKKHFHHEFSIGIIDQGETNLKISNQTIRMHAHQMIIIPAFVLHECKPVDIPTWKCRIIYIGEKYEYLVRDMNTGVSVYTMDDDAYERINNAVHGFENNQEKIETRIANLIFRIRGCTAERTVRPVKETAVVHQIKDYIEKHYLEKIELGDLEALFALNRYRLIKSFNRAYNISPLAYQKCVRIEHAKAAIGQTQELSSLAMENSFYDQPHFTKYFKSTYGITPAAYKKYLNASILYKKK